MVSRSAARAASLFARSACSVCSWSSTFRTSPFSAHPAASPRATTHALTVEFVATAGHFEFIAPVLRPRRLVVAVDHRLLFTPRLRLDAARIDPMAHEVLLRGLRAAVAQGEVVLVGAALIAVPTDPDFEVGVRLQNGDLLVEGAHIV